MIEDNFTFNARLGIALPCLKGPLQQKPLETQHQILLHWEKIRGTIPERIAAIEQEIAFHQILLNQEGNLDEASAINDQIVACASMINDLHIWYRLHGNAVQGKLDL